MLHEPQMETVGLPVSGSLSCYQVLAEQERGNVAAAAKEETVADLEIF